MLVYTIFTGVALAFITWIAVGLMRPAQSADCLKLVSETIEECYWKQATYEEVKRKFEKIENVNPEIAILDTRQGDFIAGCRVINDISLQKHKSFTITSESQGKSWRYEVHEDRPKL